MIRRMFLVLAAAAMLIPTFGRQPVGAQDTFVIKGAEFQGRRTRPHALRVTWEIKLPPGARIRGYDIRVDLSNDVARGFVVQTPSPTITAVSVGLLGIPAETREALFQSGGPVNVRIALRANLVVNGQRTETEVRRRLTL